MSIRTSLRATESETQTLPSGPVVMPWILRVRPLLVDPSGDLAQVATGR